MLTGPGYLFRGLKLLTQPGVRLYVILPLLINILLFTAAIWFGLSQFDGWLEWLMGKLPEWLQWLSWIMYLLFVVVLFLVVFFTFSLLANIVASPFNDFLCTAVIRHLTGSNPPDAAQQGNLIQQAIKSISDEAGKFAYFIIRALPLLILFIIPGVNLAAPAIWFVFTAWMLSREYLEYPMSQYQLDFSRQKLELSNRKMLSLGFGASVSVFTMIPFVNFLVMPAAVAGASALYVEKMLQEKK